MKPLKNVVEKIYNIENPLQLKWVCDKSHHPAVGQSFFFMGSVVGTIIFGYLSDQVGRLPSLLMATLCGATGDFITSFVHTLPWFAFSRFMSGLSTDTMYYLMYILGNTTLNQNIRLN